MPTKEVIFTVKMQIKSVWSLMSDRKEVGCLFPGCLNVEILNDLDSIWTLRMSLGPFSRTIKMNAHTTEMDAPNRLAWTATHEHLRTSGLVLLRAVSKDETEVTYRLEGHVIGHFSFLQDIVVSEKLGEVSRNFVKGIEDWLKMNSDDNSKD